MLGHQIQTLQRRVQKLQARKPDASLFPDRELELRGANKDIQTSRYKQLLLAGAAGTGKTLACLWKIYNLCMMYPNIRVLMVRETRSSLMESVLVTWEQHILGYGHPLLNGATRQNRTHYRFPNGSVVNLGGMDKADRVLSSEYDVIYVCQAEQLSEDDVDALISRLRNNKMPYQQLLMDCNPQSKSHWLYQRHEKGKLKMMTSTHQDNPAYYDLDKADWTDFGKEYLEETLGGLYGVRYQRLFLGNWCSAEGAVFSFDRNLHITKELPKMKRYVCGVDWGHSDPFAMVVLGQGVDNRLYVVEEILETGKTLDYIERIAQRMQMMYGIEKFVCDPSLQAHIQTFQFHDLPAIKGNNKIMFGVDLIQQRLNRNELSLYKYSSKTIDAGLAEKRLPVNLMEEFEACVWNDTKDLPKSGNDHALDALRYALVYLDRPRTDVLPAVTTSESLYKNYFHPKKMDRLRRWS